MASCKGKPASVAPRDLPDDPWQRHAQPLFSAGTKGMDGLYDTAIADPDAVYDAASDTIHVYYQTGRAKIYVEKDPQMVIRHASSGDRGKTWKVDAEPVLSLPIDATAWDAKRSETPTVLHDPAAAADRRYKMYYSGAGKYHPSGFPEYSIGLAISSDGKNFKRLPAEESPYKEAGAVLRTPEALPDVKGLAGGVVADPEIHLLDGVYHLWFSSFANGQDGGLLAFGISHATSSDGIHWKPSPNNPIPELRNEQNAGGQQPTVAWNPARKLWELWFTSDSEEETAGILSTFNPSLGLWRATSPDAAKWQIEYKQGRDFYWRHRSPHEVYGLLTGADVLIVGSERHVYYTGWGNVGVPEGFLVPTRDGRGVVPSVLNLLRATRPVEP